MTYKEAAKEILRSAEKPLHYRKIAEKAINKDLISPEGKTPWATMNAQLSVDINNKGRTSCFIRTDPGYYTINPKKSAKVKIMKPLRAHLTKEKFKHLTSKQKGDIAEARVAELIMLYGEEGLSCYRPLSDDEGIDIIVKRRGKLDVSSVQVKSTFGSGDRGFVSTVREKNLVKKTRLLLVFVYFNLREGDLHDNIFCIPAPEFLKLTENKKKKRDKRTFTVGLKRPENSKYAKFMIEKRELANRIVEIMDKL